MSWLLTFLEGLASFVSPCMLPMLPVYVVYFSGNDGDRRTTLLRSLAFVIGFSLVFILLGVFAGTLGAALAAHRRAVEMTCGAVVAILGLGYLGVFKLPFSGSSLEVRVRGVVSAFVFGLVFSLGLTPCVGAFLGAALMQAASEGGALKGAGLLAAYSAGMGVPFVVSALLVNRLKGVFAMIKSHYRFVNSVCGVALIVLGVVIACGKIGFAKETAAGTKPQPVKEVKKMEITLNDQNFEAEVLKSEIPVLVDFWAPWCGPCRMLAPVIEKIAAERQGTLKVGKVNVDEAPALASKYGIMSIPAIFVFKNGKIAAQAVGYMTKEELEAKLLK